MKIGYLILPLLAGSAASAPAQPTPSLCERMAAQVEMKVKEPVRPGQMREWRLQTLSGIGPALFGGTAVTKISVRPVTGDSYEAARALADRACKTAKSGVTCRIDEPMQIELETRKGKVELTAQPGERAEIEIRNVTIFCRESARGTAG